MRATTTVLAPILLGLIVAPALAQLPPPPVAQCPVSGITLCQTSIAVAPTPESVFVRPGTLAPTPGSPGNETACEPGGAPGVPNGGASIALNVSYRYASPNAANQPTRVNVTLAEFPAWILPAVQSPLCFPVNGTAATGQTSIVASQEAILALGATSEAPAFTPVTFRVEVDAEANPNLANSTNSTTVTVQALYAASLAVRADRSSVTLSPGQQATVTVTVTNNGNGATRATFSPPSTAQVNVTVPQPLTLASRFENQAQSSQSGVVALQAPASLAPGTYSVPIVISGEFAGTYPPGATPSTDAKTLTIIVQVPRTDNGDDEDDGGNGTPPPRDRTPGFAPIGLILAGALVALARRKR
ncbi:MAG TPA: hypothetical protein VM681_08855 [Candidatus Thermoplasmatota archaeon]|nr:hypothetical protein [Candidatus Thermoplasmatota archaeon]